MADSEKSPSTADAHKTEKPNFTGCLVWIMLLFLILWLCWPKIVSWWSTPSSDETAKVTYSDIGCFGDLFGSFNALVSMLAFIGFLCALYLQRKDLQLQREEMKQSRKEMELQTTQFREQTELLKEQIALQSKQNSMNIYYDNAYKIDELIQNFNVQHRGQTYICATNNLNTIFIYKDSDNYIKEEIIRETYNDYIKSYHELQTLFLKLHILLDIIMTDATIGDLERQRVVRIALSSCNSETKTALSYFITIAKTFVESIDKTGLVKIATEITSPKIVKMAMAERIKPLLKDDIKKRAEICDKSTSDVIDMFLESLHKGVSFYLG